MRKIAALSVILFVFPCFVFGQKSTLLSLLTHISETLNLELSYSSDLVNLNQTVDFQCDDKPDSCIIRIENLIGLKIKKLDGHLIIAPSLPKLIHLQGVVTDSDSNELLPYTSMQIVNTSAGTTTNSEGKFDFKVSAKYTGYEIEFTYLGYNSFRIKIPENDTENLKIALVPKPYTLADVNVLPMGMQAVDMVKKAVKNIKRNYHRTAAQYDAFYRSTSFRDSLACQLIEAALIIEDKGINKPNSTTEIKLLQVRKSNNYLVKNNELMIKALEKAFGGHRNMFYRASSNMVRAYQEDWWYKPLTQYDKFKYEFIGTEWLGDVKVYKVKFLYDAIGLDGKRYTEYEGWEDGGYFYINASDWGIFRIETYFSVSSEMRKRGHKGTYWLQGENEFQKIGDKYYLKYRRFKEMGDGTPVIIQNPEAPNEEQVIKEEQWADVSLLVTNVVTGKRDFDKIKYREILPRDENSYRKKYPYNPAFWKNYNILNEKPLRSKYASELEAEELLEQQFEENSSNHDINK